MKSPKTKTLEIFIGPANHRGIVPLVYVHTDGIDLADLGPRQAPKISHIRFDEQKQEWYAVLLDGREIGRDRDRAVVVRQEREEVSKIFGSGKGIPGGYSMEQFEPPRYRHDCKLCKYLGRFGKSDLYFCPEGQLGPARLLSRDSNSEDQEIFPEDILGDLEDDPSLAEAHRRAAQQHLVAQLEPVTAA